VWSAGPTDGLYVKKSNAELFSSLPGAGSKGVKKVAWGNVIDAANSLEANEKAMVNVQVPLNALPPKSIDALGDRKTLRHVPYQDVPSGDIPTVSRPRAIKLMADLELHLSIFSGPRQGGHDGGGEAAGDGQTVVYSI
jgi:hypothetical protein